MRIAALEGGRQTLPSLLDFCSSDAIYDQPSQLALAPALARGRSGCAGIVAPLRSHLSQCPVQLALGVVH
jgi:hypothetical protein